MGIVHLFALTPCHLASKAQCLCMQERKHLAFTLKDTKTVVGKLENIVGFVIHALMIFFYLVIFDVSLLYPPWSNSSSPFQCMFSLTCFYLVVLDVTPFFLHQNDTPMSSLWTVMR